MPLKLQTLKELLVSPHEALSKVAKAKNKNEAIAMLIINWILVALAVSLASQKYELLPAVLTFGILGTLVVAFFVQLAFVTIGGKGDYTSVLIASTYPFFGAAFSSFIVSLIFLWSEIAAIIIGVLLFALYLTVAFTGSFRVLKESFKLDIVTVWIATSLLVLAFFASVYSMIILYYFKTGLETGILSSLLKSTTLY